MRKNIKYNSTCIDPLRQLIKLLIISQYNVINLNEPIQKYFDDSVLRRLFLSRKRT
jgi:hypothetical protein